MTAVVSPLRDTLADAEEIVREEITARMPAFARDLARSLVDADEVVTAPWTTPSPVIPPPPAAKRVALRATPRLEESLEEDELTAKVPEYVKSLAEALITGENASAQQGQSGVMAVEPLELSEDDLSPVSTQAMAQAPMSRRRPTVVLDSTPPPPIQAQGLDVANVAVTNPPPANDDIIVPGLERRPSRRPVVGSLLVAVLSLGFAAFTSVRAHPEQVVPRIPHTIAASGAHACINELPPRTLASTASITKKGVATVAPPAPRPVTTVARTFHRAPAAPRRAANPASSKIVRDLPF